MATMFSLFQSVLIQDTNINGIFSLQVGEKKTIFDCIEFYYHWKAAHPEAVRGRTRYIDSDSEEVCSCRQHTQDS